MDVVARIKDLLHRCGAYYPDDMTRTTVQIGPFLVDADSIPDEYLYELYKLDAEYMQKSIGKMSLSRIAEIAGESVDPRKKKIPKGMMLQKTFEGEEQMLFGGPTQQPIKKRRKIKTRGRTVPLYAFTGEEEIPPPKGTRTLGQFFEIPVRKSPTIAERGEIKGITSEEERYEQRTNLQEAEIKKGDIVIYTTLYGDIQKGDIATVTKVYRDVFGNECVDLYFGENLSGQKITRKCVPTNVLKLYEPWKMTKKDFIDTWFKAHKTLGIDRGRDKELMVVDARVAHYSVVEQALKEGKSVPEKVLEEYPDLVREYLNEEPEIKPKKKTVYIDQNYGEVALDKIKYLNPRGATQRAIVLSGNKLFILADSGFTGRVFEYNSVDEAGKMYNAIKSLKDIDREAERQDRIGYSQKKLGYTVEGEHGEKYTFGSYVPEGLEVEEKEDKETECLKSGGFWIKSVGECSHFSEEYKAYIGDDTGTLYDSRGNVITKSTPILTTPQVEEKEGFLSKNWEEPPPTEILEEKKMIPENLISYETALRAYEGISFDPEKRAKEIINGFYDEIEGIYEDLKKYANTEDKKRYLNYEIVEFAKKYAKRYNDWLSSKIGIYSPMIAGPSKFPTERMRKLNEKESKKLHEMLEWRDKAIKRIKSGFKAVEIESAGGETAYIEKTIKRLEKSLETAKKANKIIKKKGISDEEKVNMLINLGYSEKTARQLLKPDIMGNIGYAGFELTSIRNKIKREREKLEKLREREQEIEKGVEDEIPFEGGYIYKNYEEDRAQIFFDDVPPEEVRKAMKSEGWHWSPRNKAWQRKLTENAMKSAFRILQRYKYIEGTGKEWTTYIGGL